MGSIANPSMIDCVRPPRVDLPPRPTSSRHDSRVTALNIEMVRLCCWLAYQQGDSSLFSPVVRSAGAGAD